MVNIRNLFISALSVIGYTASLVVYQQKSGSLNLFFYYFLGLMMIFLIYKGLPTNELYPQNNTQDKKEEKINE